MDFVDRQSWISIFSTADVIHQSALYELCHYPWNASDIDFSAFYANLVFGIIFGCYCGLVNKILYLDFVKIIYAFE